MFIKSNRFKVIFIDGYLLYIIILNAISHKLFTYFFFSFLWWNEQHFQTIILSSHKTDNVIRFGNNKIFYAFYSLWNIFFNLIYLLIRKKKMYCTNGISPNIQKRIYKLIISFTSYNLILLSSPSTYYTTVKKPWCESSAHIKAFYLYKSLFNRSLNFCKVIFLNFFKNNCNIRILLL